MQRKTGSPGQRVVDEYIVGHGKMSESRGKRVFTSTVVSIAVTLGALAIHGSASAER